MAEPTMWPERAQRPVSGLRLSVSASRPHASVPPFFGVPSSVEKLVVKVAALAAGLESGVVACFDEPPQAEANSERARTVAAKGRTTVRRASCVICSLFSCWNRPRSMGHGTALVAVVSATALPA